MRSLGRRVAMPFMLGIGLFALHRNGSSQTQGEITISVPDIPGPYCMYGIEKRLAEMPEVEGVRLLWQEEEIRIAVKAGTSIRREQIEEAIKRAEYPYKYSVEL